MARVGATSFDDPRTWNSEQSRALEGISYQLLKRKVPAWGRLVRTGNPDGGVEWYVTLADGTEQGWQAKHVHGIDMLLNAVTDSVKRVAGANKPRIGLYCLEDAAGLDRRIRRQAAPSFAYQALPLGLCALLAAKRRT